MNTNISLKKKMISVIIPVFNEEENVKIAYDAITSVMKDIKDKYNYELLFTDNNSDDSTFEIIRNLAQSDKHIRALRFSKNFGYQRSILTGYLHAVGDIAIQFDCDMQDPPELIPEFLKYWKKGYEVVYGIRISRKENFFINSLRKIFYRLINILSDEKLQQDAGDFRLISRKVLDVLKEQQDLQPYLRGAIASIGFNQIGIPYDRDVRNRGVSKFKLKDLIGLALDGIFNYSIIPLRIATFTGIFISIVSIILIIMYFIGKIIYGPSWTQGFATTTILILLSIGINALFLGIIGEYLGRIFKQVKNQPITIIEEKINF